MRTPPSGTVAQGNLQVDNHTALGVMNGKPVTEFPLSFVGSPQDLSRGERQYNIYCAPCHSKTGDARGIVATRLLVKPPSFFDDRLKSMAVGSFFQAMTHGVNNGNMPSYAAQISENDRWAIAYYIRTLQKAEDPSVKVSWPMDKDSDHDGILDSQDNCPLEVGKVEFFGCTGKQLVQVSSEKIDILETVYFKTGSDVIETRSYALLNNVAEVIKSHTEITKLKVQGHTDNQGDAQKNLELSQKRAESVVRYLAAKGIVQDRLEGKGFGDTLPIADNQTTRR
jgi:outer membrane protein OmpA-like peptidoglycan-associated protein